MSRWKQLPVAAMCLVLGGLLAVGAVFLVNYWQRWSYISNRNLRLLEVVARQAELAIDGFARRSAAAAKVDPSKIALQIDVGGRALKASVAPDGGTTTPAEVILADLLGPVFAPKLAQGAFDTLAFLDADGRVVLALGPRAWDIDGERLAAVLRPERGAQAPSTTGKTDEVQDAGRIAVHDADLAGVPYKVFVQRCCHLGGGLRSTRSAGVIGLVADDVLRREAMQFSPMIVVLAVLLLALALLAWPFLNVALRGPRRRATWGDLLPLASTGVLGLAIATILALTLGKSWSLEADIGRQLQTLAREIEDDLRADLDEAVKTLRTQERWLDACAEGSSVSVTAATTCDFADALGRVDGFTAVSLIDADGQQQRKVWTETDAGRLVDVADREYFRAARAARTTPIPPSRRGTPCPGEACVLQSLVSITTGEPSAVMARPAAVEGYEVAAIGLRLRSVLAPLLPPGFEFAVIDPSGRVHFHSDSQRNSFENLFTETGGNPQLRSLVASGLNDTIRTEYWGRPYLAHVRHADLLGWSIVTLFERRHLRALTAEWSMASLVLLGAYWVVWNAALLLLTTTGVSWLWPDRFRHTRYIGLGFLFTACLAGVVLAFGRPWFTRSLMGAAGFLVPALACAMTVLILRHRPPARADVSRLDVDVKYGLPAALLLVVLGVLPGTAFVARSYDAHAEAYLKHRQIAMARAVAAWTGPERPPSCTDREDTARRRRGWHLDFLYGTSLCERAEPMALRSDTAAHDGDPDRWWLLEAVLPFVSETSVQLRELVHTHADDGSWVSERGGRSLTVRVPSSSAERPGHLEVTTVLPALGSSELTVFLLAAGGLLLGLAYLVVRFVTRYVFLGAVNAPSWALGRLAVPAGRAVLIACDPPALLDRIGGAACLDLTPLADAPAEEAASIVREAAAGAATRDQPLVMVLGRLDSTADGLARLTQLAADLAAERRHALVLLSPWSLADLAGDGDYAGSAVTASAAADLSGADVIEFDWRTRPGATVGPLDLSIARRSVWWWRHDPSGPARGRSPRPTASPAERLLRSEERAHVGLATIATRIRQLDAFRARRLSRAEVLEELDEAAHDFYTDLWNGCSDDEKLELLQIAEFGIAHAANARAVRRLIACRLVTKDPDLRLMNRSFRRFVLRSRQAGDTVQADVERIEGALHDSSWDRYRAGLAVVVLGAAVLLYATQRDAYNATIGAIATVATQLPNLLKALTVLVSREPAGVVTRTT